MKIKKITLSNFLSFEYAEIILPDNGLVLIDGISIDTGRRNGTGKSTIVNSIPYAFYDKIPKKITATEILRWGTKSGYVEIEFESNGNTYTVKRERPTNITFTKNGIKVDLTQEAFEKEIRLNYNQFLIALYTAQHFNGMSTKFLEKTDTEKKDLLLSLSSLDGFSNYKKKVDTTISQLENDISRLESSLAINNGKIETIKSSIIDEEDIKLKIQQLENSNVNSEYLIEELSKILEPDLSKYTDIESKIADKLSDIATLRATLNIKDRQLNDLQREIKQFNPELPDTQCPYCSNDLSIKGKRVFKSSNNEELKQHHNEHQLQIKKSIDEAVSEIDKINMQLQELPRIKELISKIETKKKEESREYMESINRISSLETMIATNNTSISFHRKSLHQNENRYKEINKLTTLNKDIDIDIEYKKNEIDIYKSLSIAFSPLGAPAYVLDSIVETFNSKVSEYLQLVWPTTSYELKTFKENKRGDISTKFSEDIIIDGQKISIGSLSGGQIRGISLACDLAISSIVSSSLGINIDTLILDEPFDGLDVYGREIMLDILDKVSVDKTIICIDHASESKALFNQIVNIEYKNGISYITA